MYIKPKHLLHHGGMTEMEGGHGEWQNMIKKQRNKVKNSEKEGGA